MRGHIPQLDLLRGIAVFLVLLRHYPYCGFFHIGWVGVDLFFVLSGFLISGLLFTDWKQNRRISLSRFFIRRGFKIYPAFYVFLIATVPPILVQRLNYPIQRYAAEAFFLQDYLPHIWSHTWSLAIEEQFYILLPLLLLVISKVQGRSSGRPFVIIPFISLLLLVGCLAARIVLQPSSPIEMFTPLHFRADALFAGVALGYLFHFRNLAFRAMSKWYLLPLGLLLLTPLCFYSRSSDLPPTANLPYVLTCNTLAFVCVVWWMVPRGRIRNGWIERVGVYSYSIYLWHRLFVFLFSPHQLRFVWFVLYLSASTSFGMFMGKIIEMRALTVREKFFPSKSSPLPTVSCQNRRSAAVIAET